jgi:DNA-binding CsgD family transcriptional regulator
MVHAVILMQFFLILISSLLAVRAFTAGSRDRTDVAARAGMIQIALLALLSLDLALFYVGTNLLRANPGDASGLGLYAPGSPVTFALNALLSAGIPPFCYLILSMLARLRGADAKSRLRLPAMAAAGAASTWLVGVNTTILAGDLMGKSVRGLVALRDAVTAFALFPAALLACALGLASWLRARAGIRDPALRTFGDLCAVSFALLLASVVAGGALVSSGIFYDDAGLAWPILIQGPMLPGLILDAAMTFLFWCLRPAASLTGPGRALAAFGAEGVPEGFFDRYRLSPREREVCALVAQGLANKDICKRLGLSHGTVKNHVSSIFAKLAIASRFELLGRLRDYAPDRGP